MRSGKTTNDGQFALLLTSCLGNCDKDQIIIIYENTYSYLKPSDIKRLFGQNLNNNIATN
ncbi:MAG: NAD(P)H-dependent oxidoreductase subunit E [Arsenophonus sp.]